MPNRATTIAIAIALGLPYLAIANPAKRSGQPTPFQSGDLTTSEIVALSTKILAHPPKDQFSPRSDLSGYVDRAFRIEIPVVDREGPRNDYSRPIWAYNRDGGTLYMSAETRLIPYTDIVRTNSSGDLMRGMYVLEFRKSERGVGDYAAQNAFGVRTVVSKTRVASFLVQTDNGVAPPDEAGFYSATVKMDSAKARDVTRHLVVAVSGTVSSWRGIGGLACGEDYHWATMSSPEDRAERFCVLFAKVVSVAFVDTTTGDEIAGWGIQGSAATPPK
jgi:hypothetical protein